MYHEAHLVGNSTGSRSPLPLSAANEGTYVHT